jgi:GNAT superfamily N-acetyltransferase
MTYCGPPLAIRAAGLDDAGIVFQCWARHIRKLPPCSSWSAEELRDHMSRATALLPLCTVACNPDAPTQVYGFACGCPAGAPSTVSRAPSMPGIGHVLHMLYIRRPWRRHGIATEILRALFGETLGRDTIYITHPTEGFRHHRARWRLKFNPWLANLEAQ